MKNSLVMSIECNKVYYVKDEELVKKIDKLIAEHKVKVDGEVQALDGENGPQNPPKGGGQ